MSEIKKESGETWQQLYDEAVRVPDLMKGLERIMRARQAIRQWLEEFNRGRKRPEQEDERQRKSS